MTVVSSWGCLVLSGERQLGRLITGHEGSPPRSVPNLAHRHVEVASMLLSSWHALGVHAGASLLWQWPR